MTTIERRVKWVSLAAVAATVLLAGAREASAACVNDIECPNPACGGEVCDWADGSLTCKPAGQREQGKTDGWCTVDSDCKCASMGATCNAMLRCTFTTPKTSGTGGASGTASGGASGTASGGASGTASGGASGTATGGASGPKDSGGSSGCAVAGSPATGLGGALVGIALLGLVRGARARRRRG